jgi:APA family basic amino acid/polyamine antiporter
MVENVVQRSRGKLRREVNLITLIAVMIGLNVGGSLFIITAIGAGLTGPSLFVAQIISALPILLAVIPYLMLTSAIPTTCANYRYAKLFSRPLAVAGWMGLFVAIPLGLLPLMAIATAKLLVVLLPNINIIGTAIIVMTVFYLLNLSGVKATAYVQLATVALLILALVIFIVPGVQAIEVRNLTPLFTGGAMGLIATSAILYTLLAGGLFGIEIGDEVKNAKTTIPKALIISMVIVAVIYLFIEIIAVGVIDWRAFAEGGTLGTSAEAFLSGPLLAFFIVGGGILAAITTINLTLTAAGRYTLASAEDGFFPKFFGNINQRFGTPHWGLTLAYVLSIISLLLNPPLETLAAMLNFGLLFMITLVLLAAFRLPKTHPEIYEKGKFRFGRKTLAVTSLSAVIINIFFMIILAVALPLAFQIFAGGCIAGLILYVFTKNRQPEFTFAEFSSEN